MKESPPPDDTDWDDDEEEDDDWGDPPDEDPESEPSRKFWSLGMIIMWIVIVALAILVALPLLLRGGSRNGYPRTEAIGNSKQVGLALLEFEQDYGRFPDESTVEAVLADAETTLDLSGHSANALFRQLIAYGVQSEEIFYCRHPDTRKPDNLTEPGEALLPGEVGFSYVAGLDTDMDPSQPVLLAPMKIGTSQFHHKVFGGKAVVLRLDLSAKSVPIHKHSGQIDLGGRGLLPDPDSKWWEDRTFRLCHPEKYRAR